MTLPHSFFKNHYFVLISLLFCVTCHLSCTSNTTSIIIEKKDEMVLIPSGTLNMGGDNDQAGANEFPKHKVKIN